MIPLVTTGIIMGLASALIILWPLLELKPGNQKRRDLLRDFERLLFERERYLNNLKDLELDHQMKKISDQDYEDLRTQLLSEASGIYSAIEKSEKEIPLFQMVEKDILKLEKELR